MGNVDLHDKANEYFASLLDQVAPDSLDAQSPCQGWCAKDVIDHVTGGNRMFAAAASGLAFPTGDAEAAAADPADPLAACKESMRAVSEAWHTEGVTEQMVALPFGTLPGEVAIGIHSADVIIHSWDLAKAAGLDTELPDALVGPAMAVLAMFPDDVRGEGKPFGAKVDVGADATPTQKLVALSGRRP